MIVARLSKYFLLFFENLHIYQPSITKYSTCTDGIREIQYQSKNQQTHLMRKYKRKILMVLKSESHGDLLGQVGINNIVASQDGKHLTVFWTVPGETYPSTGDSVAQKIEALLNQSNKSIRQRIARENAFRKVPSITFFHAVEPKEQTTTTNYADANPSSPDLTVVKPNNVYNLPWDKFMAEIKRAKRNDSLLVKDSTEKAKYDDDDGIRDCGASTPNNNRTTAKWVKMWREQNNSKLLAKRDRQRSHQMLGIWQLSREMDQID